MTSTIYVHAADDGGILVIDGDDGRSSWVTHEELQRRLALAAQVLLSAGSSPLARATVDTVAAGGAEVVPSDVVHADAHRPDGLTSLMANAYVGAVPLVADLVARGAAL